MREVVQNGGADLQKMIDQVMAIRGAPRVLRLYMDLCAKCGICAEQCHVAQAMPETRTNPAARSDLIRKIYRRYSSPWGGLLKAFCSPPWASRIHLS